MRRDIGGSPPATLVSLEPKHLSQDGYGLLALRMQRHVGLPNCEPQLPSYKSMMVMMLMMMMMMTMMMMMMTMTMMRLVRMMMVLMRPMMMVGCWG